MAGRYDPFRKGLSFYTHKQQQQNLQFFSVEVLSFRFKVYDM